MTVDIDSKRPTMLPAIEAMRIHVCQAMAYDWILRDMTDMDVLGIRALDFGPGGYALIAEFARMGARPYWLDRDNAVEAKMEAVAVRTGAKLERLAEPLRGTFGIIIACNAVQHNKETGPIYAMLRRALAPGGRLYVTEALTDGPARWDANRADPSWYRPLPAVRDAWHAARLWPQRQACFRYRFARNAAEESAAWCGERSADRIVARLRLIGAAA